MVALSRSTRKPLQIFSPVARDARQILLIGDPFPASAALEMGLVNYVVPPEELLPRARELAVGERHAPHQGLQRDRLADEPTYELFALALPRRWYCPNLKRPLTDFGMESR